MVNPLLNQLLDCAKAIEGGELNDADSLFKQILTANQTTASTRSLVKYFTEALVRRVYKLYPRNRRPLVPSCTDLRSNIDYQFFPFFWFSRLTTHDSMVDAIVGKRRVHIIDFSFIISTWRCFHLMEDLAKQSTPPLSFRLTTIGPKLSKNYIEEIRGRLTKEAQKLQIDFEMRHLVANSAADVVASTLQLRRTSEDEAIVVKWEFELHRLLTVPGTIEKVLTKLKNLKPELLVIIEQEANHNSLSFLERITQSFEHYSIIFDSLEEDNFQDVNHCKVLWKMYFRRQISNLLAQEDIGQAERHEILAQWKERLSKTGFCHVRLMFTYYMGNFFEYLPEYKIEEKDRNPLLCRLGRPLLAASAWKLFPTQCNGPAEEEVLNDVESMLANANIEQDASPSHLIREADPDLMMIKGNAWSDKCFSINKIAASAEIFDMLEYICQVHFLSIALTWVSDRRDDTTNTKGKRILLLEKDACYVNDFSVNGLVEACENGHLEEGQGVAGKALSNSMYLASDVSKFAPDDYPFLHYAWDFGLHAAVGIKLTNVYMSSIDYVIEFFLPPEMKKLSLQKVWIKEILSILKKNRRNSWTVYDKEFFGDNISTECSIPEAKIPNNITPASTSSKYSLKLPLTSRQMRALAGFFDEISDEEEMPEASDQMQLSEENIGLEGSNNEDARMRNVTLATIYSELLANDSLSQIQLSEENMGLEGSNNEDARMRNIRLATMYSELQSNDSLTLSQVSEFFDNLNQTDNGEEMSEAHDQMPSVPEAEEQGSTSQQVPLTIDMDSTHRTIGIRKRRRTSKVWNYFDFEFTENEVWAKCKGCGKKFRAEGKMGTSTPGKHVKSCPRRRQELMFQ